MPKRPLEQDALRRGRLGHRRGKRSSLLLGLKTDFPVGAVAKWLIFRMSASAEADGRAARKIKNAALRIADFEIALDAQRAVVADSNLSCCQEILPIL